MSKRFQIEDNVLVSYLLDENEVVIPEGVTRIGRFAFNQKKIENVTFPSTLEVIDEHAFSECHSLSSLAFPLSLKKIDSYSFTGCIKLKCIHIPSSVNNLSEYAFHDCIGIENITVDENNEFYEAFDDVLYNKEKCQIMFVALGKQGVLHIKDGVKRIDHQTFKGCSKLTQIILPQTVESMGGRVFQQCSLLESVNFPPLITDMGTNEGLFIGCKNLKKIDFENKELKVKTYWFGRRGSNCIKTETDYDIIRNLVTSFYPPQLSLDMKDFLLTLVAKLIVHDSGIKEDWKEAWIKVLRNKKKRKTLYVLMCENPDVLTLALRENMLTLRELKDIINISKGRGCVAVTATLLDWQNKHFTQNQIIQDSISSLNPDVNSIPEIKRNWAYKKGEDGALVITSYKGCDKDVVVPSFIGKDKVSAIGDFAFSPNAKRLTKEQSEARINIESVTIDKGIQRLGDKAFWNCKKLNNITLPSTIKEIKGYREDGKDYGYFYGCDSLSHIFIPSGVTNITDNAFSQCFSLETIEVSKDNSSYSSLDGILYDKNKETLIFAPYLLKGDVNVPPTVKSIKPLSFSECKNISSITFSDGIKNMDGVSFEKCENLTKLKLPAFLESIKPNGYFGFIFKCEKLKEITLPDTITEIVPYLFYNCYHVEKITIGNKVEKIGIGAFSGCLKLTSLNISDTVREIGSDAFHGCRSLSEVHLPEGIEVINETTFRECMALKSIKIPSSVKEIKSFAFDTCNSLCEVIMPENIERIEDKAFQGCSSLKDITLPFSLKEIGYKVFLWCDDILIHAKSRSVGSRYAKDNNIAFEEL